MRTLINLGIIFLLLAPIFLMPATILQASAQTSGMGTILFSDDFENYKIGAFSSTGGWELIFEGRGGGHQAVTGDYAFSRRSKSLQPWEQTGWTEAQKKGYESGTSEKGILTYVPVVVPQAVKFRGMIVNEPPGPWEVIVKIDEILSDPEGRLSVGDLAYVDIAEDPSKCNVDWPLRRGDRVEVYAKHYRYGAWHTAIGVWIYSKENPYDGYVIKMGIVTVTSTVTSTKTLATTITNTISTPVYTVTSTITRVIPTKITTYLTTTSTSFFHTRVTTTSYCTETRWMTTTKTVYTTVTTTVSAKPSPQHEFSYIEKEESIPEGAQKSFLISGAGRALVIKVEATDRLFLLGAFIRNKYSIIVYQDDQQITTLKPEISRIDPPGDPIIYELVIEPKRATYRIVVKTEDIGCLPLIGWLCNGDRVRIQILLGLYTTKWAEKMHSAYEKAAQLWTNPGAQFIADMLSFVGGKPELENIAKMFLYYLVDLVGFLVFGVEGISNIIELWELALTDASGAAVKGNMAVEWPFRIYPCMREWVEDVPECTRLSPENRYVFRQQLKEFYESVGYPYSQYSAGFGTPPSPPQWDYIKMQLGFMAWSTRNIYYALRIQNYERALNYMYYNQKFRQHLEWIAGHSSDDLALNQPWKGMYDHTRMIVMLDLKS